MARHFISQRLIRQIKRVLQLITIDTFLLQMRVITAVGGTVLRNGIPTLMNKPMRVFRSGSFFFKGIIKKFDLSQTAVPTDLLRRHLATHIEDFRYLHPRKFELLVRDIYRDFFSCEVKHVGGPGDNGVDLFAIIGDQSYLIQAKRRANPDRAESAATVREFIGTLIAHDATRGHIVTTASHYSNSAFSLPACEGVRRHNIDIELKTLGDIFQMLRVANSRLRDPWDLCPRGIEPPSGRKIDGYFSPSGQLHLIDRLDSMALGDGGDVLAELAVTM